MKQISAGAYRRRIALGPRHNLRRGEKPPQTSCETRQDLQGSCLLRVRKPNVPPPDGQFPISFRREREALSPLVLRTWEFPPAKGSLPAKLTWFGPQSVPE